MNYEDPDVVRCNVGAEAKVRDLLATANYHVNMAKSGTYHLFLTRRLTEEERAALQVSLGHLAEVMPTREVVPKKRRGNGR